MKRARAGDDGPQETQRSARLQGKVRLGWLRAKQLSATLRPRGGPTTMRRDTKGTGFSEKALRVEDVALAVTAEAGSHRSGRESGGRGVARRRGCERKVDGDRAEGCRGRGV